MKICPISGKKCYKKRTHHITDIKHGKVVQSVDLCEDCVRQYIEQDFTKIHSEEREIQDLKAEKQQMAQDVLSFFQKIVDVIESKQKTVSEVAKSHSCPKCGTTAEDIYKIGKFGCLECYKVFDINSLLMKLHGATQHVGKVPKKWKAEKDKRQLANFDNLIKKMYYHYLMMDK